MSTASPDQKYAYVLWNSSADVNEQDWRAACAADGNPFMDLRFMRAVEKSMADAGKYWFAVFYNALKQPVACTCFSLYTVDGALLAPPAVRSLIQLGRRLFSRFFRFKVLLCGLPVSISGGQIAAVPSVDWSHLVRSLDEIAVQLARAERASIISFKEFDAEMIAKLSGLASRGYRQSKSVVTYSLDLPVASFEEYYNSRSKRTRANMRKVFKKFDDSRLRYVQRRGKDGVPEIYTNQAHELYEAVLERAEVKFEHIPAEFFRELARCLPDESRFTFLYQEDRVVGFCCAVARDKAECNTPPADRGMDRTNAVTTNGRRYHMIYCGIDYELNAAGDVYFNTLYRALEDALSEGPAFVQIGASADEFKRRMGCQGTQLFIYVKVPGVIPSLIFQAVAPLVLD